MNEKNHSNNRNRTGLLLLGAVFGSILLLSLGFMAGRATSSAEVVTESMTETITETITETVTEIQEVTREVPVVITNIPVEPTSEPIEKSQEIAASDTPEPPTATAVPTALPPSPTPEPIVPQPTVELDLDETDMAIFLETWQFIEDEFDGMVPNEQELLNAAITGSLETLDDEFTRYFPPDVAERLRLDRQGSFSGIGAYIRENDNGQVEIIRPIEGQPADLVGLMPGDIVTGVDGESVAGMSLDEVLLLIRGEAGTEIILTVLRLETEETLEEMFQQNPNGIILDLRDNGGGFLDQSVAVADVFLTEGVVLFERNNRGLEETFRADNGDIAETLPLVVLVNANSASASEIVAGAIQDNGRGILIGETTFGKGSVQSVHGLSDGSELRVTIARWYTPNNHTIDGEGIDPDIPVESPSEMGGDSDTQLQRAIEYLQSGGQN